MISADALQVGFLSSLMIVNKGSTLTIVNKVSSLTIVNETTIFIKMIVSFSLFRRRFHNETIVFLKNENVNIPRWRHG